MDKRTALQLSARSRWDMTSVFGTLSIPSIDNECICKWTIKINKTKYQYVFIGMSSAPFNTNKYFYLYNTSYVYGSNGAVSKCINGRQTWLRRPGELHKDCRLKNKDTINLCLDLKNKKLSFSKMGNKKKLWSFKIKIDKDIEYKLGVVMFGKNCSATITAFELTKCES